MGSLPVNSKPYIIIVPGSFSPPHFYSKIVDELSSHGYETTAIHLPSIGRRDPTPPATMADDAAYIQSVTSKLADEGKEIIMVTHSYGGICGTESLKGLAKADREAAGKKGGISRVLYVTSLVPSVGQSLKGLMGDFQPDYLIVNVSWPEFLDCSSCKHTYFATSSVLDSL